MTARLPRLWTPVDLVLIVAVLAASGAATWRYWSSAGAPVVAEITHAGRVVACVPLSRDTTVTVMGDLGPLDFEVSQGRIRCVRSNCPRQICIQMGWKSRPGEAIICVPNRVAVTLFALRGPSGAARHTRVDAITR